jgi:integrase
MRQDEILSLEWANVDLFRRTATVVRSKNGEKRTIPLNLHLMELLRSKAKVRSIKTNFVFFNEAGSKIDAENLLRGFTKVLERFGIQDFRFHDLRHTFATRLAQAGVDFYKISKLLGHKDIRMTQRYSHHYPESLRDGVELLDKIITNS